MRVELIYSPGCSTYKKALAVLQEIIADEQLPIAVEVQEQKTYQQPLTKVNGSELVSGLPCAETFRSILSQQWKALTAV